MKKFALLLFLASCTFYGSHAAATPGIAYKSAFFCAAYSPLLLECRDLTDEEMDDADNLPGGGYSDGKWTGENPPNSEDEDGNPCYEPNDDPDKPTYDYNFTFNWCNNEEDDGYPSNGFAYTHIYEDEEGRIWVIDEDGEMEEVTPEETA